jgi:hypothetical protein
MCDFQDLYRYLIDDFVIGFCRSVDSEDFILKEEDCSANRKEKGNISTKRGAGTWSIV